MGIFDPPKKNAKQLTISDVVFAVQEFHNDSRVFKGIEVDTWKDLKDGIKTRSIRYAARHRGGCHGKLAMDEGGRTITCAKCTLNVNRNSANVGSIAYRKEITLYTLSPESLPMKMVDKHDSGKAYSSLRQMTPEEAFNYYYPELKDEVKITLLSEVQANIEGVDELFK